MKISEHPLYNLWSTIRNRCHNKNYKPFPRYGGRGVKMCDRWRYDFYLFAKDMGPRPSKKHQVDRINNDGDYSPENCRWSTSRENCRNKSTNKYITYNGETLLHCEWAERLGLHRSAIGVRLKKGWTEEEAVTTPKNYNKDRTHNPPHN